MRLTKSIVAVIILAASSAVVSAQQPTGRPAAAATRPATTPAPTTSAPTSAAPAGPIAVIDIEAFGDQKAGIQRLLSVYQTLEREFKPRRDELQTMATRREALTKEYENLQKANVANPDSLQKKLDEIQTLEKDMKRKQEDGQAALQKREAELSEPVWRDINTALLTFAQQRGISLIFEKSKLAGNGLLFVVNDQMDITRAFITEYNQRNPATTAAAPASR